MAVLHRLQSVVSSSSGAGAPQEASHSEQTESLKAVGLVEPVDDEKAEHPPTTEVDHVLPDPKKGKPKNPTEPEAPTEAEALETLQNYLKGDYAKKYC